MPSSNWKNYYISKGIFIIIILIYLFLFYLKLSIISITNYIFGNIFHNIYIGMWKSLVLVATLFAFLYLSTSEFVHMNASTNSWILLPVIVSFTLRIRHIRAYIHACICTYTHAYVYLKVSLWSFILGLISFWSAYPGNYCFSSPDIT